MGVSRGRKFKKQIVYIVVPNTPRLSVDDLGSYILGEDSFNKFTEEMVKQFMKEEEMRAQHQVYL